jgi:hypothetical protein
LHVRRSTDRGQTWSADVRTITDVKNPSLAINSGQLLGLAYQQFNGTQWVTQLELTSNAWGTPAETHVLHRAPANTPGRAFLPYLGDYIRLLAVGRDFYGVFSGNNTPDTANFPSGVTYQRGADWTAHTLLNTDGVTPVTVSIDPFFFRWAEGVVPIGRGPVIARGPITRTPIIPRGPIIREPIIREPIVREPIIPRGPIGPEPPSPVTRPEAPAKSPAPGRGRRRRQPKSPKPPKDIEL